MKVTNDIFPYLQATPMLFLGGVLVRDVFGIKNFNGSENHALKIL